LKAFSKKSIFDDIIDEGEEEGGAGGNGVKNDVRSIELPWGPSALSAAETISTGQVNSSATEVRMWLFENFTF
jgi:hypothetical protein